MAYVPTEWATGDVITAEKLNKIENGIENISSPIYVVTITNINYENSTFTYDKTWNEVKVAFESGKHVILRRLYVGTMYKFYEVESASYTTLPGALNELQFFGIDVNQQAVTKNLFTINENSATFTSNIYNN